MNVKYTELEGKSVLLLAKYDRQIPTQDLWMSISSRHICPSNGPFPACFEGFYLKRQKFHTLNKRLWYPSILLVN